MWSILIGDQLHGLDANGYVTLKKVYNNPKTTGKVTFRRRACYGWISINRTTTGCALVICKLAVHHIGMHTAHTCSQDHVNCTPYHAWHLKVNIPCEIDHQLLASWVIFEFAIHDIGIHTAQYMLAIQCKLHTAPRLTIKLNVSISWKSVRFACRTDQGFRNALGSGSSIKQYSWI